MSELLTARGGGRWVDEKDGEKQKRQAAEQVTGHIGHAQSQTAENHFHPLKIVVNNRSANTKYLWLRG